MSTREAIHNLQDMIKAKSQMQVQHKAQLHRRHGSSTPSLMQATRENRIQITACLNYLHELKGTAALDDETFHTVAPEDWSIYAQYLSWLRDVTEPSLDAQCCRLTEEGVYDHCAVEMDQKISREVRYLKAVKHGRIGWFGKLLHALGRSYTG